MINTLLLKSVMVAKGHTNKTLSANLGLSQNAFSAKINNKARMTLDEMKGICQELEIQDMSLKCQIFLL